MLNISQIPNKLNLAERLVQTTSFKKIGGEGGGGGGGGGHMMFHTKGWTFEWGDRNI